jgi:hypothetical protein
MAQLWAATVLVHWLHVPGLQHWHGRPALAQGQLRKEQEAVIEQKQQRSLRALVVFCLLSFLHLLGGALNVDEEQLTPSVLIARRVCSWRWLAASAPCPGALDGSGSRSSSITSGGCCGGPCCSEVQCIIGSMLYYAQAVDITVLMALSSIAIKQSKGTTNTIQKAKQLLNYLATYPDATICFRASNMIMNVHSNASYLSKSDA